MEFGRSLHDHLEQAVEADAQRSDVNAVIDTLAAVAAGLSDLVGLGALAGHLGRQCGRNAGGDIQKALDVEADDLFRTALRGTAVAAYASEESEQAIILDPAGSLCLGIDPIDGSGNIDLNMPLGTIFSILPMPTEPQDAGPRGFAWPAGTAQCAAGFFVYGPQTTLILTAGPSVDVFTLDRSTSTFRLTRENLRLPAEAPAEYAINGSNYRHWEEPVRSFVDECLAGAAGPFGRDFNMRWHGALVAEAHRILMRGGVYLYPGDARHGYRDGRLRLVYEAFPIALLMERAGGAASNGRGRILEIAPKSLHQHVPLIAGSSSQVDHIEALHHRPGIWPQTATPLFSSRGLFRS